MNGRPPFSSIIDLSKLDLSCPEMSKIACVEISMYIGSALVKYQSLMATILDEKKKLGHEAAALFIAKVSTQLEELRDQLPALAGAVTLLKSESEDDEIKEKCDNYLQQITDLSTQCSQFLIEHSINNIKSISKECQKQTGTSRVEPEYISSSDESAETPPLKGSKKMAVNTARMYQPKLDTTGRASAAGNAKRASDEPATRSLRPRNG